jgi:hypothetical protein
VFRYHVRAIARPGRYRPRSGHRWRSWGSTLRGVAPPAGVAAFPPLGPTCRFSAALSRRIWRSMLRRVVRRAFAPTRVTRRHDVRRRRPRLLGFVPACGPRRRRDCVESRPRPMPPWALPLSGLRTSPSRSHAVFEFTLTCALPAEAGQTGGLRACGSLRTLFRAIRACRSWALWLSVGRDLRRGLSPLATGHSSVTAVPFSDLV